MVHGAFQVMEESTADAVVKGSRLAEAAFDALEAHGIPRSDLRTTQWSLTDWVDQQTRQVSARVATYGFAVTVRSLADVGPVLERLGDEAGAALQVQNLQLVIGEPDPLLSESRRLAVEDARSKAAELAEAAGVALGPVVSIVEGGMGGGLGQTTGVRAAAASLPVEPGTASVTSRVTVTFGLQPDP